MNLGNLRVAYVESLRADGRQPMNGTALDVRLFGNTQTIEECWEYQGTRNARTGHGRIDRDGKIIGAHRAAYESVFGPVPDGKCVLHACDNPPCVNPSHLWIGTYADNNHDRDAKGRTRNQWTGKLAGPPPGLADALHLGGNGLVPQCAAEAWGQLLDRCMT